MLRAASFTACTLVAIVAIVVLPSAQPGYGQTRASVMIPRIEDGTQEDFRIVEIVLRGREEIASDVIAYEREDGLLLPLGELMLVLGFPVDVDASTGQAQGWFLRENQKFTLDLVHGEAVVAARRFSVPAGSVETDGVELFVSALALEEWFALGLSWQSDRQVVELAPSYLLPGEEAARRAGAASRSAGGRPEMDISGFSNIYARPGLLSSPAGGLTFSHVQALDGGDTTATSAGVALTGDVLFFTADLTGSFSDTSDPAGQLVLSRRDAGGRLLGPLQAREIRLGDLSLDSAPLIGDNVSGVGVTISRERFQRGTNFDTTRIEGNALPGWQAELYRDGQLLSFLTVPADGRFIFIDVPLLFGTNRFTVELYGPAGERQSVDRTVDVSDAFLPRGQFEYAFEALSVGDSLFSESASRTFPEDTGLDEATASDLASISPDWQGQVRFGYGLSSSLTVSGAALIAGRENGEDAEARLQAGLAGRAGRTLWTLDAGYSGDGAAMATGVRADLGAVNLTFSGEQFFDGFQSARNGVGDNRILSRADLRLDGRSIYLWQGASLNWALSGGVVTTEGGRTDENAAFRFGGQFSGISINNSVNWRAISGTETTDDRATEGVFNAAGEVFGVRTRLGFDYSLAPEFTANRLDLNLSKRRGDWFYSVRAERDMRDDINGLGLGVARDWNGVRLGLDMNQSDDRGTDARFSLSLNIDRGPSGHLRLGREARGQRGSARVRVFHDENINGQFDPGEIVLPEARLLTAPRGRQTSARDQRIALEDLPVDRETGVALDTTSLPDPYLTPALQGVRFLARPGASVAVDLPVIESGEVEWLLTDAAGQPREGVIASLKTCHTGETIMRERAAFDGLVLFQFVPPGCYVLSAPGEDDVEIQLQPGQIIVLPGKPAHPEELASLTTPNSAQRD